MNYEFFYLKKLLPMTFHYEYLLDYYGGLNTYVKISKTKYQLN